ncbi:hypothetical protein [Nocardia puris]|uniref:Uncharacterized protein n=1 Tax=Nocardia puris TaxID=208602 RepID=A0A366DD32_9NOCA|nr:hypothetical protein [Nocardia puris]RBO87962.1 hypothetical protein DFR74_110218 [Nocardia puris]
MPPGSRYRAAQDSDQRLAARLADLEPPSAATSPEDDGIPVITSSAGYTTEVHVLLALCDLVQQLNATLIAINLPKGKQPPKVRPMPRPVTAIERERAQRERSAVDETLADLGL